MSTPLPKAVLDRFQTQPEYIPSVNVGLLPEQVEVPVGAVLLTDEKVLFTQDKAAWYIDLPVFEGERNVREEWVQVLLDEMMKGNFNANVVILASAEYNGKIYKINGQHTSWAKIYLPHYTPTVCEQKYRVNSEDQLRQLYGQFDRNRPRTDAHITSIHLAYAPELVGVPKDLIGRINKGVRLWLFEPRTERSRIKAEDLARMVRKTYAGLYQQIGKLYTSVGYDKFKHLKRAPTTAAMLATFSKNQQAAHEFWTSVANGENLSKEDPRLVLRDFLTTTSLATKNSPDHKELAGQEEMYRKCLVAWNKWRDNEKLKVLRSVQERPKVK